MLRAIFARNTSRICVPTVDDRLYFPRLQLSSANDSSEVTLTRDWAGFGSLRDKTTAFGAWVNRTLALFGCPADDEAVGNWYYYTLVAGWGGAVPEDLKAEVKALVCVASHPCKLAAAHLPLCQSDDPAHGVGVPDCV